MFPLKKILLIGFVAILLITIPVTMFVLQQQQEIRSQAQASTSLSFTPLSTTANPYQVKVDDTISLDVMVNPNGNKISFVRLEIQYDPTKLAPPEDATTLFVQNKTAFPVTNQPVVNDTDGGKVIISVSIDPQATTDITTLTKVGTLQFKAIEKTETPTQVVYGIQTQVLSKAENDQASEDVLLPSGKTPAIIAIVEGTGPSPSVSPTESITPSPSIGPTASPSPTVAVNNIAPACISLTADVTTGTAPLTVNFTAIGSDTDGTVEKVTFNLGDTNVTSVTENLSLSSVSAQLAHTYTSGGTFTATAVITDEDGGTSTNNCPQTITVSGPTATPGAGTPTTAPTVAAGTDTGTTTSTDTGTSTGTDTGTVITEAPTPTIADPGPGAAFIGLGAFFTVLSLIGAIMFFAL